MLIKKHKLLVILSTLLLVYGCSNQAAYEIMQSKKIQACERVSEGQAREDCMRGYQKSFEQYDFERRQVIGDKKREPVKPKLSTEKDSGESSN